MESQELQDQWARKDHLEILAHLDCLDTKVLGENRETL